MRKLTLSLLGLLSILGIAGCASARDSAEPNSIDTMDYTLIASAQNPVYNRLEGVQIVAGACSSDDSECLHIASYPNSVQRIYDSSPLTGNIRIGAAYTLSHFFIKQINLYINGHETQIPLAPSRCGLTTTLPSSNIYAVAQINLEQKQTGSWIIQCTVQNIS